MRQVRPSSGHGDRRELERRPGLDGMRAIAVAAVVAFHLDRLPGGNLGVDAFLVISGWVITSALLASVDPTARRLDLSSFWSARVRRLLPASAVTLVVVSVVWSALEIPVTSLRRDVLFALGWAANWGTITSGGDYWARFDEASPVAHFWSLAVEEQFYLVWPVVLWVVIRAGGRARTVGWVALALAAASVTTMIALFDPSNPTDTYLNTGARAHSLLLGAAAAVASLAAVDRPWIGRTVRVAVLPAAGAVAAILILGDEGSTWLYRWGFPTFAAGMAVVVMWVAELHQGGPLGHPALRWVGDRSYGIYLWHWPVILLLAPPRVDLGPGRDAACIGLSVALASASHRWLEQPIRRSTRVTWRWAPGIALATLAACALVLTRGDAPTTERVAEASVVTLPPPPALTAATGDDLRTSTSSAQSAALPSSPARVLVVGDSTAVQLADTLMAEALARPSELAVASHAFGGCGLSASTDGRLHSALVGGKIELHDLSGCAGAWEEALQRISREQIDVVLVSIGAWDGTDIHRPEGDVVSVLEPAGRRLIGDSYRAFVAGAEAAGARVEWVLPADLKLGWGRFDTVLDDPERWAALRALIRSLEVGEIDLGAWLVAKGLDGPDGRPDGVHLATAVRERFVAELVLPELLAPPNA
jgi:peptidoglycan/LPS O-acetylase OafA/YrhL